jgi:tripartite-type tricarboxylate transporter receptor subunit TctC
MRRRDFLRLASGTVALGAPALAAPNIAGAQAPWPDKPVRIIVPFAAGGGTDLVARPWADKLSQAFRQQFIVENRGGASGLIGAEAAAKSAPDGYTFLVAAATSVITVPLLRKVPYDHTSFQAVGRLGDIVCGFVVHPSIGATTFIDAIDYAKENPGKMAFGSSGTGTVPHMRFEMLKFRTGVDILHVPYRGGADSL